MFPSFSRQNQYLHHFDSFVLCGGREREMHAREAVCGQFWSDGVDGNGGIVELLAHHLQSREYIHHLISAK